MARPVAVSTDAAALARRGKLQGWSVRNTHATDAATIDLYDNASAASGTRVGTLVLAAAAHSTEWFNSGVQLANGLYYDVGGTGTIVGCVYIEE